MTTSHAPVDTLTRTKGGCGHPGHDCDGRIACCNPPACCELECVEIPRFYCGMILTDSHLTDLVKWVKMKFAFRRFIDGWGVACGLSVRCDPRQAGCIIIEPG